MWCKYCCLRIDRLYIICVKLCILITKTSRCLIGVHRLCTTYYVAGTFPVSSYNGITCERVVLMWIIQMQRTPVVDSRKISLVMHYHPPISRRLLSTADRSHHPRIKYFKQKDTCSWQQQTTQNALKTTLYINKELVFNTDSERSGQHFSDIWECLSVNENSFECWSKFHWWDKFLAKPITQLAEVCIRQRAKLCSM